MKILIIDCHPYERSFTRAISRQVRETAIDAGAGATLTSLYDDGFDPVLSGSELARRISLEPIVQEYTSHVLEADHIVFVHPDWWSGPPALLKGWIDRVFRPGVAYDWIGEEFTERAHTPLLTELTASVYVTTDRTDDDSPESIRLFWKDVCSYSGMQTAVIRIFTDMRHSTPRSRREHLKTVAADIRSLA